MLLNQLALWVPLFFFICVSIFIWIKWRNIGFALLILIITLTFIYSYGIAKYSILGSMRLNAIPTLIDLETDSESVSSRKAILDSLKSWNKMLRGKKPIYITSDGSQISLDPIGEEKSIKFFKRF